MRRLSQNQVLLLHKELIERFGGADGGRDYGLLSSSINTPFQTFDGDDLYPDILEKAVRLGYGLVANHPFIDGNKRVGTLAMTVFLRLNGITLSNRKHELIDIILNVAAGDSSCDDFVGYVYISNEITRYVL